MNTQMRFHRVRRNPSTGPRTGWGGPGSLSAGQLAPPPPGGSFCPPYNPFRGQDVVLPGCGKPVTPLCDVQQVAFRQAAIVNQTATTFTIAPIRTNYFQGLAIRVTCVDGTNPDTNRRAEVHSVDINGAPQEPWSNNTVLAGNTSVVHTDVWTVPEGYGVPIAWGIFAQANLIHTLQLGVFTRYGAGVTVDMYVSIFGNALSTLPAGVEPGVPFI